MSLEKSNGAGSRTKRKGLVEWHVWLAKLARSTKSGCCACAYLQTPIGSREFENYSDGRPDHVDFKIKFNAQTAVEGVRNIQAQL